MDNKIYFNISKELARIVYYSINVKNNSYLYSIASIANILSQLIDYCGTDKKIQDDNKNYALERILRTMAFINENYSEKISLNDISSHIGIHPQYFSAFFKKEFHTGFIEYLTQFRISKSISLLMNTNYSITDIAIQCGFSDHKSYGTAFKKIHKMTPTQFKKFYLQNNQGIFIMPNVFTQQISNPEQYFSFFQRFWHSDDTRPAIFEKPQQYISLSTDLTKPGNPICQNRQLKIDFAGRTSSCLRSDVQQYIRDAKKELKFDYLRIRDVFSDDLYIYYEDADHHVHYNWNYIDLVLDFFMSIQVKPVIEIGFMPSALASKNQRSGWQYHPNVSFPRSLSRWADLVSAFIEHCISRYDITEIRNWYFDVWTSPNLPLKEAYWYDTQENFFKLYRATWQAIKTVDKDIPVGTPTFSLPSGADWYEAFFRFCGESEIHPDYISLHTYNCGDGNVYAEDSGKLQLHHQSQAFTTPYKVDFPIENISQVRDICAKFMEEIPPIISMSWNLSFFPSDYTRDTCFMAPYLIYTSLMAIDRCQGLCYWSLCDTNDELYPDMRMFAGNPGMIDTMGIKKPVYYALKLFRRLGTAILEKDETHVLSRSSEGYQLLIYNFSFYDESYFKLSQTAPSYTERYKFFKVNGDIVYHHSLTLPPGTYTIRRTELNQDHGSTYDTWLRLGSPERIDPEMVEYIQNSSMPKLNISSTEITHSLILDTIIPEHGVVLYEIIQNITRH